MSTQHTPGRLVVAYNDEELTDGHEIRQSDGDPYPLAIGIADRKEDARRLVACWNACEGIDTEDLEFGSFSVIEKLHDKAAKELLAELKQCDEVAKRYILSFDRLMTALKAASDQIDALGGDSTSYRYDIARVERRHHAIKESVK